MNVPILTVTRRWYCPNCAVTDVTRRADIHTRGHECRGLHGLYAPLLEEGVKAKVEAVERGDYVSDSIVNLDDTGRAVMSVITTRDEGQDCLAFADAAIGSFN